MRLPRVHSWIALALSGALSVLAGVRLMAQPTSSAALAGREVPTIPREFRGAWVASVANIDWPSRPGLSAWEQQAELIAIFDRARQLKLNAILLQVRPAGDALYASTLEPWSAYLTGVEGRPPEPYYDPLVFAVKEAHARGLELHAWFNPYRARHPSATGAHAASHMSRAHPEWVRTYGKYEWMDPGEPGVLDHSVRVVLDVVARYDLDGIHVDDYFYPYPEAKDGVDVPFPDSTSYSRYRARGGMLGLSDWRRRNVDQFVERIYRGTKARKPWVKVGISPFGIWRPGYPEGISGFDAYEKLAGDSRKWLREGWVDYFTPQLYWPMAQTAQSYTALLGWWLGENAKRRHLWVGHNASRAAQGGAAWGPDELTNQVRATRQTSTTGSAAAGTIATGDVMFSMRALMPAVGAARSPVSVGVATQPPAPAAAEALADRLAASMYQDGALVPASPWLGRAAPARPMARLERRAETGDLVVRLTPTARARWFTIRAERNGAWASWVLPGSYTSLVVGGAADSVGRVVVTAVDRNGNEGAARRLSGGGR